MKERGLQCSSRPIIKKSMLYVFRSRAASGPRAARICARYASPSAAMATDNHGEYSSHSPGVTRFSSFASSSPSVTPKDSAVFAEIVGAEKYATVTVETVRMSAVAMLCQVPIVWRKGMEPLIFSSAAGMDDGVAIISAAEDERPSAQMLPVPR